MSGNDSYVAGTTLSDSLLMIDPTSYQARPNQRLQAHVAPPLSESEFFSLRKLILQEAGIALGENRIELLRNRLRRRLMHHGLSTYREYYLLLRDQDPFGKELVECINGITTNKTDFFREPHHFEFLKTKAFPEINRRTKSSGERKLRVWSAACSTGEEPYSIAMTALEYFGESNSWDIRILGSDIDSKCLETAMLGRYPSERIENVSMEQKTRSFQRGRKAFRGIVRVRQEIRDMVKFRRINFVDPVWPIRIKFDAIFCRNALIYFEQEFQRKLIRRFLNHLKPDGHLFFGHSENLSWMPELKSIGQTIYVPSASQTNATQSASQ